MKVLVCGGRYYHDRETVFAVLDSLPRPATAIIHGGARGADSLAGMWARSRGVYEVRVRANWAEHGKAAGHLRNQQMLDEQAPEYCVAFPGGRGTADMVRRCEKAGVIVWIPFGLSDGSATL